MGSLNSIELCTIDGETRSLGDYADGPMLIVNVASRCVYSPQYAGLEALYRHYKDRGLAVLGFPCDQFGHQEPGGEAEIKEFCALKYDVTFPLFAKTEVNGANAHPLFKLLKAAAPGLLGTEAIKWNFTKFLVEKGGGIVRRYPPSAEPESLAREIEGLL